MKEELASTQFFCAAAMLAAGQFETRQVGEKGQLPFSTWKHTYLM
jgi:hypothetical protein